MCEDVITTKAFKESVRQLGVELTPETISLIQSHVRRKHTKGRLLANFNGYDIKSLRWEGYFVVYQVHKLSGEIALLALTSDDPKPPKTLVERLRTGLFVKRLWDEVNAFLEEHGGDFDIFGQRSAQLVIGSFGTGKTWNFLSNLHLTQSATKQITTDSVKGSVTESIIHYFHLGGAIVDGTAQGPFLPEQKVREVTYKVSNDELRYEISPDRLSSLDLRTTLYGTYRSDYGETRWSNHAGYKAQLAGPTLHEAAEQSLTAPRTLPYKDDAAMPQGDSSNRRLCSVLLKGRNAVFENGESVGMVGNGVGEIRCANPAHRYALIRTALGEVRSRRYLSNQRGNGIGQIRERASFRTARCVKESQIRLPLNLVHLGVRPLQGERYGGLPL
jgi:hypothetical protein